MFLLLVFFLVTSTFLLPERQIASNITVSNEDSARAPVDLEPAVVEVMLMSDKPYYKIGAFTTEDERQLIDFLSDFVNKQDGAFVRASDDVPFEITTRAIAACRIGGFETVTYVPTNPN